MASLKRSAEEMEANNSGASSASATPTPATVSTGALKLEGPLPMLCVLDLDKTVWPVYCHEETKGPYTRYCNSDSAVSCSFRYGGKKVVRLFPEVVEIMRCLQQEGIKLAIASRSPVDEGGAARGILGALGLLDMFSYLEIHRGSKAVHFQNIHTGTGVQYRDMIFFDDERDNIRTVSKLGVTCVKLRKDSGLTFAAVNLGLKQYREACASRSSFKAWFTPVPPEGETEGEEKAVDSPPDGELLEQDT